MYCVLNDWNYRREMWRIGICGHCDPVAYLDALLQYQALVKMTISKRDIHWDSFHYYRLRDVEIGKYAIRQEL
ncbi:hypothetical protein [Planococcus sp. APC 3900]|uniref:hypothetical protein n=1 Tax=Planococcus sp. APC 3900 TaxID=3035191 RepID=UPI0025B29746|nr:hypothetical protein [Planococcus sp. APC 3900]